MPPPARETRRRMPMPKPTAEAAPDLSILVFARLGWDQADYTRWSEQLLEAQIAFVTPSSHDGAPCARFAIVNPLTTVDDLALILTTDFFTPIVDDPYDFGAVAAANALSDVYAMGGTPLMALSIVGFPDAALPPAVLVEILRGAGDKELADLYAYLKSL